MGEGSAGSPSGLTSVQIKTCSECRKKAMVFGESQATEEPYHTLLLPCIPQRLAESDDLEGTEKQLQCTVTLHFNPS